jgi:flagellar biosynthetic protein FliQ
MDGAQILDIGRDGIWVMILVAAPMMTVGLVVGIVIALFQALTQIQEQTLVFVPKILAIFVTMVIALPFMGATMSAYMVKLADLIVTGG